ncbi:MAG: HAMP domain-containing sensor histidine kinase [Elusimicrobiota bacterium]
MNLSQKLALSLSSAMAIVLCGVLGFTHLWEIRSLERRQDALIERSLVRLASRCEVGDGHEDAVPACSDLFRAAMESTLPEAFILGVLLDRDAAILSQVGVREAYPRDGASLDPELRAVVGQPGFRVQRGVRGGERRVYSVALSTAAQRHGTIVAVYSEKGLRSSLEWLERDAGWRLLQGFLLALALGILMSVILAWYLLSPLRRLSEASERIGKGDFSSRVPEDRADELGLLASRFNTMASRLGELDKLKDDFISKVTHDLRNPLNAILGKADLLLGGFQGPLTPKQTESARAIVRSCQTLAGMVSDLLDLSRLESGRMKLEPETLDLASEAESLLESMKEKVAEAGVCLSSELRDGAESAFTDAGALRRILSSLLSNALQFTPSGGKVELIVGRGGGRELYFRVADNGIGIPKRRLGSLFTKFFQVPETRNKVRPSQGAGLGLALSRLLAEALGGRIEVESEELKGSRFTLFLPEKR